MVRSHVIAAVFTLVIVSACKTPNPELAPSDVAAIKASYTDWATATAKRDTVAIAKLVTADAWVSDPNAVPITGRAAVVSWTQGWPQDLRQTWSIEEVSGYGDLAYSRATATETMAGPDATPVTVHAVCLCVHRRQPDGAWLFARSVCHSSDPLPPAAPAPAKKR